MKQIIVDARMIKRVRESGYVQDRKGSCLVCRQSYADCPHSWYEVDKVCRAVRGFDGKDIQVVFDL